MTEQRPTIRRAPYHDQEGRLALPIDPASTPALLPSATASAVLGAAARASDPETLAALVVADPALAEFTLAVAASPLLGAGRAVGTIRRVIRDLGAPAVRDVALIWALRSIVAANRGARFDIAGVLLDATRRASIVFAAAQYAGYESPREAFTASLLQDFGVIVMGVLCPDRAGQLDLCQARPADERVLWERAIFGGAHTEVFASFTAAWHLPPGMAQAVAVHHDSVIALADRRAQRLAELLRLADAVTDLCQVDGSDANLARARAKLTALRSRRSLTLAALLDGAATWAPDLAATAGLPVPPRCTLETVMGAPTRTAVIHNIRAQGERGRMAARTERTQRMEQLQREKEGLARELQVGRAHLALLRRVDAATGVSSRRELCTLLGALLSQVQDQNGPLSVVLVELEDAVNATGDPIGADAMAVLREAATRIRAALRAGDVLGRIGSDVPAFGVLLPGCDAASGPAVVARLHDSLCADPVVFADGRSLTVRAAFGGTTVSRGALPSIEEVVEACERAVDQARADDSDVAWHPCEALG